MKKDKTLSRRRFIGITGAAVGASALASVGLTEGWGVNRPEVSIDDMKIKRTTTDVLVIGGGMAGLFAAIKAHDAGAKVTLVSKGRLGASGQTPFAKGIFDYNPETAEVTIDEFVDKVSLSARGTNIPVYTRMVAEQSHAYVEELRSWGFFDSALYNKSFRKPIDERKIEVIERVSITHLEKESGRIVGAAGFGIDAANCHIFSAKSVILCTGAGGFKPNGFPICDLTHDGTIMAYKIGAKVTGKEWNDGHPGKATNSAACYDGWGNMFEQKPSTTGVSIRHDLGVDLNYMAYVGGNPVRMGVPGQSNNSSQDSNDFPAGPQQPEGLSMQRGPGGPPPGSNSKGGRPDGPPPGGERNGKHPDGPPPGGGSDEHGGGAPPGMGGISVGGASAGLAIHKSEGLVPINDRCESTIPGLFAAGDALGSCMAGAIYTQIGSSLAGSAVQGGVAGKAAAEYASQVSVSSISRNRMEQIVDEIFAPLKREAGYSPAWVTQTLQGVVIPNFVLYIKKESMLRAALAYVEEFRDHHMPRLRASSLHELRLAHETENMIYSAEMKLRASLMRKESRCSHYRLDYPDLDNENWQAWIHIYRGEDGKMNFEKQPFSAWRENR